METGFITVIILIFFFVLLASYDGIYLHLIKFRLYHFRDSKTEHLIHTIRAILFPLILYFLFLSTNVFSLYLGLFLVLLDLITLGVDAYSEKNSRAFMGGLPQWEYILHLFVNGFHFAGISVFIVLKIKVSEFGISLTNELGGAEFYSTYIWFIKNLIPGAVIMALVHFLLCFQKPARIWDGVWGKILYSKNLRTIKK